MARTHSSYTASPTRMRSPQRSTARRSSSEDGSQYEMDLDALGLNSTFESTALEGSYEPPVDRVDTSDVEGPDDFTMNMTYWMTADVLPAQVKSRKEKQAARHPVGGAFRTGDEGDKADHAAAAASTTASPTVRVDGTTASPEYSTAASERSMENDEKVRSFLSALPDAGLDHLPPGTPVRVPRQSLLQVPRSSPPKARSLQPTVEDADTPRKPTQQTVIHHPSPTTRDDHRTSEHRIAELHVRLDQQELASRARVTELETILAYTRTDLDAARNDNYKHRDTISRLEHSLQDQRAKQDAVSGLESRLKHQEDAHQKELRETKEQLHQAHLQELQTQRKDLDHQLSELHESRRAAEEEAKTKSRDLEEVQARLAELRESQHTNDVQTAQEKEAEQKSVAERTELHNQLASVQARADSLQASLSRATAEAQTTASAQHLSRIAYLETHLQDTNFSLECAQADAAAKAQLFQTNINLSDSLRALRNELDAHRSALTDLKASKSTHENPDAQLRVELTAKDQQLAQHSAERDELERQLGTAQGRISGLETSLTALRTQLTTAHRENGSVRADVERLAHDLEDANDCLAEARAEAERRTAEAEKKLAKLRDVKSEADSKYRELKSQHDDLVEGHAAMLEDVRDKAEDAVRKTGALLSQERKEKSRYKKEAERLQREIEHLRSTNTPDSHAVSDSSSSTLQPDKDAELLTLRTTIESQASTLQTLKASHATTLSQLTAAQTTISTLQSRLATQATEHLSQTAAIDAQLASRLSALLKQKARHVVGKRDTQWEEVQRGVVREREVLGKVLMREWGRGEWGVGDLEGKVQEGKEGGQVYGYKYVRRER